MGEGNKVTVLGAGNAAHTFAWRMASRGTEVMIWEHPDFSHNLDGIRENNGLVEAVETFRKGELTIHTDFHGKARIAHTTTDIEEAMTFSDVVFMSVPGFAHESMFKLIMPYLRDGHLLNVFPGNYCSLIFARMLREANLEKNLTVMEGASIPFACRVVAPGRIFVGGVKDELEVGVFPSCRTDEVRRQMTGPNFKLVFLENIIATGLGNGNIVAHPATAVLNMGIFESRQGQFYFYREGMSDAVSRVQQRIDDERLAVAKGFGLHIKSFIDIVNDYYDVGCNSVREFAVKTTVHNAFGYDAPSSSLERYVSEDVSISLVAMHDLGAIANVQTTLTDAIINIASVYNDVDYFQEGRNLKAMGLEGMSKDYVLEYLNSGHR
jgi:opine dehydrogenase